MWLFKLFDASDFDLDFFIVSILTQTFCVSCYVCIEAIILYILASLLPYSHSQSSCIASCNDSMHNLRWPSFQRFYLLLRDLSFAWRLEIWPWVGAFISPFNWLLRFSGFAKCALWVLSCSLKCLILSRLTTDLVQLRTVLLPSDVTFRPIQISSTLPKLVKLKASSKLVIKFWKPGTYITKYTRDHRFSWLD